jgi:uncharacterized membrane protein YphA (DoxX/SURF4 family)
MSFREMTHVISKAEMHDLKSLVVFMVWMAIVGTLLASAAFVMGLDCRYLECVAFAGLATFVYLLMAKSGWDANCMLTRIAAETSQQ